MFWFKFSERKPKLRLQKVQVIMWQRNSLASVEYAKSKCVNYM